MKNESEDTAVPVPQTDYEQALNLYLEEGINYGANTIKNADVEDLKQLASDSFHAGYQRNEAETWNKAIEQSQKVAVLWLGRGLTKTLPQDLIKELESLKK